MMLIHTKESIQLFVDYFHYMIRNRLSLEILQELLCLFLFLVFFICKMLFKTLIYLFKLLLSLGLVSSKIVLLFQFIPDFKLVYKICE